MLIQAPWLRVLHVNEGAQLDAQQRAALKTLASQSQTQPQTNGNTRKQPHKTLVTLGGNFLGPSVQSALDGGGATQARHWAVDLPEVTHACLGLYEANHLPLSALAKRLDACTFSVLATNATELAPQLSYQPTTSYDVIEVWNGRIRKRIALTGLLSHDPHLYALGGAVANTGPVTQFVESGRGTVQSLKDMHKTNGSSLGLMNPRRSSRKNGGGAIDLVVPLTHASLADNRLLAHQLESNIAPVLVCGGSSELAGEEPRAKKTSKKKNKTSSSQPQFVDETQANGVRLVQPAVGQVAVIDIQWKAARNKVSVKVQMVSLSDIKPHPDVLERGLCYEKIFWQALSGRLFRVDRWRHHTKLVKALQMAASSKEEPSTAEPIIFSTQNNTNGPSVGMSALATLLRLGWTTGSSRRIRRQQHQQGLAAVLLPASCVVGNRSYNPQQSQYWFTWRDLQTEMPDAFLLTTALLPGRVLQAAVRQSRLRANAGYLHTCSNVQYSANDVTLIERIGGQPLDLTKEYWVAFPVALLEPQGTTTTTPLTEWAKSHPNSVLQHKDVCQSSDLVLAQAVAPTVWFQPGSFLDLRVHGIHGWLTKPQIQTLIERQIGPPNRLPEPVHQEVAEHMTEVLMSLVASVHETDKESEDGGFDSDEEDEHDDEDIVTPVDVMMTDCIVQDAVLPSSNAATTTAIGNGDAETAATERDQILRDCAADFVGVDDHTKQVTEVVESFLEELLDDDNSGNHDLDGLIHNGLSLGERQEQPLQDAADDLHAPLVKRLTRRDFLAV